MNVCGIPVPFFGDKGGIKVLLTAVGLKIPSAFQVLLQALKNATDSLDLDSRSVFNFAQDVNGRINVDISICEFYDSLPLLLGIGDECVPHLGYHVVVGAALAESREELEKYSFNFEKIVKKSVLVSFPCLFVFSSKSYDGVGLAECATQIPSDSSDEEIDRRVRQAFMAKLMTFFSSVSVTCDNYLHNLDDHVSCLKLASYLYMIGGENQCLQYLNMSLKNKNPQAVATVIEQSFNPKIHIDSEKISYRGDFPSSLEDIKEMEMPQSIKSAIMAAHDTKDRLVLIRLLLRLSARFPAYSRRFLSGVLALSYKRKRSQYILYSQLALMMLKELGHNRTFAFQTNQLLERTPRVPPYILKPFIDTLTQSSDWCEQRLHPSSMVYSLDYVPREIKNGLVEYVLTFLHIIRDPARQQNLLSLLPSSVLINADIFVNIGNTVFNPQLQPIESRTSNNQSSVFIYSPISKRKVNNLCSVGETMSFQVSISNPLKIKLHLNVIALFGTNCIAKPISVTIESRQSISIPLNVQPSQPGKMEIFGFSFSSGNLTAIHYFKSPFIFTVIDELPIVVLCRPFINQSTMVENSINNLSFELINTGSKPIDIKCLSFGPTPPVLTSTSLPICYPPVMDPPMPDYLDPGQSHSFSLKIVSDITLTSLSFGIQYGREDFIRAYQYHQDLSIISGPQITRIQVLPLDDHDDFLDNKITLIVVIENPTDLPISITCNDRSHFFVQPHSFGAYIANIERIDFSVNESDKKWSFGELTLDHVRKCETTATKEKNSQISKHEKQSLWRALYLKLMIRKQLPLNWVNKFNLSGTLPFSHVVLDQTTLLLLQPPPFSVNYELNQVLNNIWELQCIIDSLESLSIVAKLSFEVEQSQDQPNFILVAGSHSKKLQIPGRFSMHIHCLPSGSLTIIGKFFIGDAFFIRRSVFELQKT